MPLGQVDIAGDFYFQPVLISEQKHPNMS